MSQGSSEWRGSQGGIGSRLNREWSELVEAEDNDPAGSTARWRRRHPVFEECRDLDAVLEAIRSAPDVALAALIGENHAGSELAGRVVLQTMLGKMIKMADRDRSASLDDYVSHLWLVIRAYPLAARRHGIASNLALDTLKAVVAEDPARRAKVTLTLISSEGVLDWAKAQERRRLTLDHNGLARLTADRTITEAWRRGLIDQRGRDVLTSIYADELSGRQAALRLQLSCVMVRYVCSRTVRNLAAHRGELAAAA